MKKVYFWLIFGLISVSFSGCRNYYLVDSEGFITLDGIAKRLDAAWTTKSKSTDVVRDTVYVKADSIR